MKKKGDESRVTSDELKTEAQPPVLTPVIEAEIAPEPAPPGYRQRFKHAKERLRRKL